VTDVIDAVVAVSWAYVVALDELDPTAGDDVVSVTLVLTPFAGEEMAVTDELVSNTGEDFPSVVEVNVANDEVVVGVPLVS